MLCIKCKKEIPDGSAFCNHCGKEQNPKPKKRSRKRPQGSGTIRKDERNKSKPWVAISPSSRYGTSRVYLGAFRTYKEAQDAIEKYEREGRPELYGATLEDIYKLWSESHYKNVSASAAKMYRSIWNKFEPIKSIKMADIRAPHFQTIVDSVESKAAADLVKVLASMVCKYAMQNDVVDKNYAQFVKVPKAAKKEKKIFTQQQINLMWDHSDDIRIRYILFMIYTGLRISEFLNIELSNIHIDEGYFICGGKTEAGKDRIVPIPPAIPELGAWLSEWAEMAKKKKKAGIIGMTANHFRTSRFYPALEEIGIDCSGITPHTCRHTFASLCASAGIRQEQLQKIIGHADFQTTANIYIHQNLESLKEAMSKLEK